MKQCWQKLGVGDLDLFPNWWKLIGFKDTKEEKEFLGFIPERFLLKFKEPPRFCVICSRIRFDPDVREYVYGAYSDGRVTSLNHWLKNNEVSRYDMSYREFMLDDTHEGIFGLSSYQYQLASPHLPDKPLAVLYVQQNVFKLTQWANTLGLSKDKSTPTYSLELIPLEETSDKCDVLEG